MEKSGDKHPADWAIKVQESKGSLEAAAELLREIRYDLEGVGLNGNFVDIELRETASDIRSVSRVIDGAAKVLADCAAKAVTAATDINASAAPQVVEPTDPKKAVKKEKKEKKEKKKKKDKKGEKTEAVVTTPAATSRVRVFGEKLGVLAARENGRLPLFLSCCIDVLRFPANLRKEGVLRHTGSVATVAQAKEVIEQGGLPQFSSMSVHEIASLLKQFLLNMPDSLLTGALFHKWVAAGEHQSAEAFDKLFKKLPEAHQLLLLEILRLVEDVLAESTFNKMSVRAVGETLGEALLRQPAPSGEGGGGGEQQVKETAAKFPNVLAGLLTHYRSFPIPRAWLPLCTTSRRVAKIQYELAHAKDRVTFLEGELANLNIPV